MDHRPEDVRGLFEVEYGPMVRLATLITGDVGAAEDIVQEAFVRTVARWSRIRSYDNPGAWLRRITIRLAVRDRTRRRREHSHPLVSESTTATGSGCPDVELVEAMAVLPPNQRAALLLFYFEGLSTDEVAQALSVGPSTTRSYLHRGRAALALQLAPREVSN